MIRRLLTALSLAALACVFSVRADDEIKGSNPTRKDVRPTREVKGDPRVVIEDSATRQAALKRAFESFRQRLTIMAGRLENGTDKDKARSHRGSERNAHSALHRAELP